MAALRSLAFALLFYPGTLAFVLTGLAASVAGPGPARAVVRSWAGLFDWLCRNLLAIRLRLEGEIPTEPLLIAVKHESMYETIQLVRLAHTPVIVLKRELSRIPLFGWMTRRYGVIPVDRDAGAKALRKMVALGRAAKAEGRPVMIYPEGTRVRPGEQPPLRSGFAGLYRALGLPVLPIAVASGRVWGHGFVKRGGTVRLRVGEIVPAGLDRSEIEARVHAAINALQESAAQPRS